MFQTVDADLPPMSKEMLKLRSELWEAEGMHLIYNVRRRGRSQERTGPLTPFAGLCVAVLMYLPNDNAKFSMELGKMDKKYVIGWVNDNIWGIYSLTWAPGWEGYRDVNVKTFPKGYVYIYFYFKNSNTLHGWINDNYDLKDDTAKPYAVSDVGNIIKLGYPAYNDADILEIHWVAWGSSHNRSGGPSRAVVDKLFPRTSSGMINFKDYDIFEIRTGTVVTARLKYEKNAKSEEDGSSGLGNKDPASMTTFPGPTDLALTIGIGCATCKDPDFQAIAFEKCTDPKEVYTFRVTFSEKGALIHKKDGVSYVEMASYEHETLFVKCRAYLTFNNVKPVHVQVETMGQTWE